MATMDIPGLGEVKKEYVYAGGALVVGIAGMAWYRARAGGGDVVIDENDAIPAGEYEPPAGGGTDTGDFDTDDTGDPRTNSEWAQRAVEFLSNFGWQPVLVSRALGKYLTRTPLTLKEATAVRAAVGAMGYPPEGGPYPIQLASGDTDEPEPEPDPKPDPKPGGGGNKGGGNKGGGGKKKKRKNRLPRWYRVREGDTLSHISLRFYKDANKWRKIYRRNRGKIERIARRHGKQSSEGGKWIYPGTRLRIPK